jgi:hypothetical protein
LATLNNWKVSPDALLRKAEITVRAPDGRPIMSADVERDVASRVNAMERIRFWSFVSLVAVFSLLASVLTTFLLRFMRRNSAASEPGIVLAAAAVAPN